MNPLKPPLSTLVKLGSIVVHADEMLSASGHPFDVVALKDLIRDSEVEEWVKAMGVFMPLKREQGEPPESLNAVP